MSDDVDNPRATGTLRERTRRAMRDEVASIATRLFAEQGCSNTTVDQIAAEAGLSRTTFFRYFGTKEDVVLTWIDELGPRLLQAFSARPADEHPWRSLHRALGLVTDIHEADVQRRLDFESMLEANPTMKSRQREKQGEWQRLLIPAVAARMTGDIPAEQDPRPRMMVACAIESLNAAHHTWRACDGAVPLAELLDRAMNVFEN